MVHAFLLRRGSIISTHVIDQSKAKVDDIRVKSIIS